MLWFLSVWTFDFPGHKSKLRFNLLCIQDQMFKHLIWKVRMYVCICVCRCINLYVLIRNFFTVVELFTGQEKVGQKHLYLSVFPQFWELLSPVPTPGVTRYQQGNLWPDDSSTQNYLWQGGVSSTGNNMCILSPWRFWKAEETFWKGKQSKRCP